MLHVQTPNTPETTKNHERNAWQKISNSYKRDKNNSRNPTVNVTNLTLLLIEQTQHKEQ